MGSEEDLEAWEARSEKVIAATAISAGTMLAVMEHGCEREDIRAALAEMARRDMVVTLWDVVDTISRRIPRRYIYDLMPLSSQRSD